MVTMKDKNLLGIIREESAPASCPPKTLLQVQRRTEAVESDKGEFCRATGNEDKPEHALRRRGRRTVTVTLRR